MKIPAEAIVPFDRINYYQGKKPMTGTVLKVTNNGGKIQLHLSSSAVLEYEYNQPVDIAENITDLAYNVPIRLSGHTVGGVSIE